MLSEYTIGRMHAVWEFANERGFADELRSDGPASLIDALLNGVDDEPAIDERHGRQNLIDNRAEAERYLAGLMGMM